MADAAVMTECGELRVTISVGATMVINEHGSFEDVIANADDAPNEAKYGGRNRVTRS